MKKDSCSCGKRGLPHSKGSVPHRLPGRHHAGLPVFLALPPPLDCTGSPPGRRRPGARTGSRAGRRLPDISPCKRIVRAGYLRSKVSCRPSTGIHHMNRTGISPVTTRTVVWSPATALACNGLPSDQCGFRLWRTPPSAGKPDAGVCVVLCCKEVAPGRVPQGSARSEASVRTHSSRPEPTGSNSRRHETRKAT